MQFGGDSTVMRSRVHDRYLYGNLLIGTIPTTIGQLTALTVLYVVASMGATKLTPGPNQESEREQFDWDYFAEHWTIIRA
jgi:hypothetical protein